MAKDGKKNARKKHKGKNGKNGKRAQRSQALDGRWRPTAMALAAGALLVTGVTSLWRIRR